ncbi:MAG: hypothetical protein RLZ97_1923 [Verrucomicrobiota bacterium]
MSAGLALSWVSCERHEAVRTPGVAAPTPTERAKVAAMAAFETLSGELSKAMTAGGPVAAIAVCSEMALPLTVEVGGEHGVVLTRLSDRPRRPGQDASGADAAALTAFREAIKAGEAPSPQHEEMPDGSTVVRLPIVISQPVCLQCHGGDEVAAETRAKLQDLYPDDQATGYKLGELRGLWRVEVPAAE